MHSNSFGGQNLALFIEYNLFNSKVDTGFFQDQILFRSRSNGGTLHKSHRYSSTERESTSPGRSSSQFPVHYSKPIPRGGGSGDHQVSSLTKQCFAIYMKAARWGVAEWIERPLLMLEIRGFKLWPLHLKKCRFFTLQP